MDQMRDYSRDDLLELAESSTNEARLASSGSVVGIALPDWVQGGQLLGVNRARELAAQLLLEADLHEAIIDSYVERLPTTQGTRFQTYEHGRPLGDCPRRTPGCKYADCSHLPGRSCYGPNAPQHVDMGGL